MDALIVHPGPEVTDQTLDSEVYHGLHIILSTRKGVKICSPRLLPERSRDGAGFALIGYFRLISFISQPPGGIQVVKNIMQVYFVGCKMMSDVSYCFILKKN